MTEKLYKLQTDATGEKILIYDKDRENVYEGRTPWILSLVMGKLSKRYAMGKIVDGQIELNGFLPREHTEDW